MPDDSADSDELPKTLSDVIDTIESIENTRFPTIKTFLEIDQYFGQFTEALAIVKSYESENDYNLSKMNSDLLKLSAIRVSTSQLVGFLQGYARRSEDERKIVKSHYAAAIKRARDNLSKQGVTIKLNDTDAEDNSRILAKAQYQEAADAETISRMVSQSWYAIGDFCNILNASINREHQELTKLGLK